MLDDPKTFFDATAAGRSKTRALLDTNVWRYVIDHGAQGHLLRLARDGDYDVQIAPTVVYETLRIRDVQLRARLVRLMTNTRFHRLMPDAYSESMEILREIQRIRPAWRRPSPDIAFFRRLKNDWTRKTGGFWVRCARSPDIEAAHLRHLEGELIEAARAQSKFAREEMLASNWKRNPPMDKTLAGFNRPVPGWSSKMVEAWRFDSLISLTFALGREGDAYRDWIAPFVELDDGLVGSAAWNEFWLHLADQRRVPRQWMRWGHSFAQRFRRVTPGAPADTAIFTYFLDSDLVITADKALLDILEECRPYAPCALPNGVLIAAGAQGVRELFARLGSIPARVTPATTQRLH